MEENQTYNGYSLPSGTILHQTYRIQKVLGEGGFGIIYVCDNLVTGKTVAIKEYFPSGLAKRERHADHYQVQPLQQNQAEFDKGHRHFLEEARILMNCQTLEGIVTVFDFFEEEHTAYIVMEYIEGPTLKQYIQTNGAISYAEIIQLMTPVMYSLSQLHKMGLIHRDISPDNLILGLDNQLHLIDFGAAKSKSLGKQNQQTIILKKGYAPPEQYLSSGNIGAWIDIYALCATMYFAISGRNPVAAIDRLQQDTLLPLTSYTDLPPQVSSAIERGLSLHPADRFQSMEELSLALAGSDTPEHNPTVMGENLTGKKRREIRALGRHNHRNRRYILPFGVLTIGICLAIWLWQIPKNRAETTAQRNSPTILTSAPVSHASQAPETTGKGSETNQKQPTVSANKKSTGTPPLLTMIDVTGQSSKKAKKRIHALDSSIQIKIIREYNDTIAKDNVISQNIVKNTIFNAGSLSEITLTISKGSTPAKPTTNPVKKPAPTTPPEKKPSSKPSPTKSQDFNIKNKPSKDSFQIN